MPTPPRSTYHHGDLRRALLAAADAEIRAVGAARLSLRELARRAGVSHAAPAHHFGDKRGVFTALATEGYRLLHEQTAVVLAGPDALIRAGEAYVAFALSHPSHFAVMFDTPLLDEQDPHLVQERESAFANLFQAVARSTGVDDEEVVATATAAWGVVHGLATLWLGGNLPYPRRAAAVPGVFVELAPAFQQVAAVVSREL